LFLLLATNDLYIAERDGHKVRIVSGSTGVLTTIAGTGIASFSGDDGAATSANLSYHFGLWVASSGNVFIADNNNQRIRVADGGGSGVISTIAGTGSLAFSGDGGLATDSALYYPAAVLGGADGSESLVYVTDRANNRIRTLTLFAPTLAPTAVPTATPTVAPTFSPQTLALDLYITTFVGTGAGSSAGDGGAASAANINSPRQTWIDSGQEYLYVVEYTGNRVRRVALNSGNIVTTFAGTGNASSTGDNGPASSATLKGPVGVHGDSIGHFYISELNAHQVRVVDASSGIIEKYAGTTNSAGSSGDEGAATSAQLNGPHYLAGVTAGNLFIADFENHKTRKVAFTTGIISTYAGTGIGSSVDNVDATSGILMYWVALTATTPCCM
jgi:hypothetical protein